MHLLFSAADRLAPGPVTHHGLSHLYSFPPGPWLRANMVSTVDGAVQGTDGLSGTINGPADAHVFALNRALADCVLVGAGTARAEQYRPASLPIIVVSARGQLPESLERPGTSPVILATSRASGRTASSNVWLCGVDHVDLGAVVSRCVTEGMAHILCEGGPQLLGALAADDLVDDLAMTTTPLIAGGQRHRAVMGAPDLTRPLSLRHVVQAEGALLTLWRLSGR